MSGRIAVVLLISCIVIVSLILFRSSSSKPQRTEPSKAQPEQVTPPPAQPIAASPASPPAPGEARTLIQRIYKDAVTVDESRANAIIVGDFNGDDSQDIAVLIRPVKGQLPQLNSEYANWIVEDMRNRPPAQTPENAHSPEKNPAPVKVEQSDLLLTIVHGYQRAGWRDPLATQTYLLKNAAGDEMKMESALEMMRSNQSAGRLPGLRGDLIRETLAGESGFLYWTGARYAWQKAP
ncbi:MAG TPA: hypothetical protein VGC91_16600 [Pyrinomonadaceae bacterium]|jgi:hypothetical protein